MPFSFFPPPPQRRIPYIPPAQVGQMLSNNLNQQGFFKFQPRNYEQATIQNLVQDQVSSAFNLIQFTDKTRGGFPPSNEQRVIAQLTSGAGGFGPSLGFGPPPGFGLPPGFGPNPRISPQQFAQRFNDVGLGRPFNIPYGTNPLIDPFAPQGGFGNYGYF